MSTKFYAVTAAGEKGALLLTLDYDMIWTDELEWTPIVSSVSETSDMGEWTNEETKVSEAGRLITLESSDGMGYQTKATASALKTLFEVVDFRAFIEIISNGITVEKKIRCRHEDGGIQFRPHKDLSGLLPTTFMYGGTAPFKVVS